MNLRAILGLGLLLAATGCDSKDAAPGAPAAPSAKAPAASATDPKAPAVETQQGDAKNLCAVMDLEAIGAAVGIDDVFSITSTKVSFQGNDERNCVWGNRKDPMGGLSLGASFSTDATPRKRDSLGRYTFKPFDGLGAPATIGRGEGDVAIQTVAKGVRVIVSVGKDGATAAELEPKVIAMAKAVLAAMPDDPAPLIRGE